MNAKLTRVHLGFGIEETGIQFELDDGAGGTVKQRAFVVLPDDVTKAVWSAAQSALDVTLSSLPTDMPPGAVTTALMQARNARQEADKAHAARRAAEEDRQRIEQEKAATEAEHARQVAEAQAKINALADRAKQAEEEHIQQQAERDREAAEKQAALDALNAQIAAAKAEAKKANTDVDAPTDETKTEK